jgi:hypothetical protein
MASVERDGRNEVALGELISWDYCDVLGVPMQLGRQFLAEEDETPGTHRVAILGHRTWVQDFGADPAALGQDVQLGHAPYTIVGVAPEAFTLDAGPSHGLLRAAHDDRRAHVFREFRPGRAPRQPLDVPQRPPRPRRHRRAGQRRAHGVLA